MSDARTIAVYGAEAARYAALSPPSPRLADFIAALPAGARVLDLGCGPGQDAGAMADAGLKVDALDACPEMVALAAARPGVAARRGQFEDLAVNDPYHGIWANFSLLHVERDALPGHLKRIRRALHPGGLFHIAMKTGSGAGRDRLGRYYTYWTVDELHRLLRAAEFHIGASRTGQARGLSGSLDPYAEIAAHA